MAWRTSACLPKDQPRSFMRLLEQGPESQSASWICSVGPSSLMNASDLDDHIFVPLGHNVIGIEAHCPIDGIYGMLRWLAETGYCKLWALTRSTGSSFSGGESVQSLGLPQHLCASFSHCHCVI